MRIGLFVPCYIDQFYPDVAMATVELLERCGVEIDFPREQTCCGQPMANTGCQHETRPVAMKFLQDFSRLPVRRLSVGQLRGDGSPPVWRLSGGAARF